MSKELTAPEALDLIVADLDSVELEKEINIVKKSLKAFDLIKDNVCLEFTHYFEGDRYEVWLNRGDEEPILIADTKEEYELLSEVFKR